MDYKETIWVTGCKGFLGREIVKRLKATYNCTVVGTDKELMVTDPERIDASVRDLQRLRTQLAHASPAEAAAWQCAHDMARALPVCGTLLAQHLGDEEDLVIPLLALREAAPRAA